MAMPITHVLGRVHNWSDDASDAVLLRRYVQKREEIAFATLVARHGSIVLRLCRQILVDVHEAEDAFQATFLILARRAGSLKQPETLACWLYGVARRVALKARTKAAAHTGNVSAEDSIDSRPDPLTRLTARELLDILDEEVRRLPPAQRSAVVLCCLEEHTREQAAHILGWTLSSVKAHLQRGRQRLQERLKRRGIALSAVLAIVAVGAGPCLEECRFRCGTMSFARHEAAPRIKRRRWRITSSRGCF